jgi:hypothetical protein
MNRVILEHESRKLANLTDRVEFCDGEGRTLGYFVPVRERSLYEGIEIPVSDEELRRAEQQEGGRTTVEVLRYLGILEAS